MYGTMMVLQLGEDVKMSEIFTSSHPKGKDLALVVYARV